MKAIQTLINGQSQIIQIDRPKIGPDDVLIKTSGCGVCGTDLLKINLKLLKQDTILGHEICGQIVETGENVKSYSVGETIVTAHHVPCFACHYCQHENFSMCEVFKKTNLMPGGFTEFIKISKDHLKHTTFKVPRDMPWQEAIFTEPLACCVRNLDRLNIKPHDTIIVVGLGSIGLMMAKLLQRLECHVAGVDLDLNRCQNALTYGVNKTFTSFAQNNYPTSDDFTSYIYRQTNNRGADGVIFTAGPAGLLDTSIHWIRNGGFVNLFSHLSGETTQIDTAELYHREIQIISTYSSSIESLKNAFKILKYEKLNLIQMFTTYEPEEFNQAIEAVNQRKILKALIRFNQS